MQDRLSLSATTIEIARLAVLLDLGDCEVQRLLLVVGNR